MLDNSCIHNGSLYILHVMFDNGANTLIEIQNGRLVTWPCSGMIGCKSSLRGLGKRSCAVVQLDMRLYIVILILRISRKSSRMTRSDQFPRPIFSRSGNVIHSLLWKSGLWRIQYYLIYNSLYVERVVYRSAEQLSQILLHQRCLQ